VKTTALVLALAGTITYAFANARIDGGQPRPAVAAIAPDPAPPTSAYWVLERRYALEEHQLGALNAQLREARGKARRLGGALASLRRRHRRAMRTLQLRVGGSDYAIRLAASTFGVDESQMRAVASCETGGTFSPAAYNAGSGASGLFQFLGSTWRSQGLAGFSVWDPVANALAAARIVAREGWGQWSCQP